MDVLLQRTDCRKERNPTKQKEGTAFEDIHILQYPFDKQTESSPTKPKTHAQEHKIFGGLCQTAYFCTVFFIVLDLRLTRLGYRGIPFFMPLSKDCPKSTGKNSSTPWTYCCNGLIAGRKRTPRNKRKGLHSKIYMFCNVHLTNKPTHPQQNLKYMLKNIKYLEVCAKPRTFALCFS